MRNLLLLIFVSIFSLPIYADNFLQNELLEQMLSCEDASIVGVLDGKYYLNTSKIVISADRIYLDTDIFGPLQLTCVMQDLKGMYLGLYYYYTCDNCGRAYQSRPSQCGKCGGTSFTCHEQIPGNDN